VILADTSVWIDHLRESDPTLQALLEHGQVMTHPFVIGELAVGGLRQRETILNALAALPHAVAANEAEVLMFIDTEKLFGIGLGYIDAHLLAASRLTPDALLWTRDKRLRAAAERLAFSAKLA
jgi:predicted nucleic acid-binding protein